MIRSLINRFRRNQKATAIELLHTVASEIGWDLRFDKYGYRELEGMLFGRKVTISARPVLELCLDIELPQSHTKTHTVRSDQSHDSRVLSQH